MAVAGPDQQILELRRQLNERNAALADALQQQAAIAEVLEIINRSAGDLTPVFDAILEKANSLCETAFGVLWTFNGTHYLPGAIHGPQAFVDAIKNRPRPPAGGGTLTRHAAGEHVVHIEDMSADSGVYEASATRRFFVDLGGGRSALSVALRKDGALFGALQVYRQEVRPFSEKQIALLENFAAQAVIAMENARLIAETREALEQQTATAEVLGVINSSPGDLTPVFDAMLEKATRLCDATFGVLWTYDGDRYSAVSLQNVPTGYAEFLREPQRAAPSTVIGRLAAGEPVSQIADIATEEYSRLGGALVQQGSSLGGFRTVLGVALRKDDTLLGAITIYRQHVQPFADKQIALLQNFAAQAVIAIENARLITETREALEQQTATSEVLAVINSSPGDLAPVFEAILEKAHNLCGVVTGGLSLIEDGVARTMTIRGAPEVYAEAMTHPFRPPPQSPIARLIAGMPFVLIPDMAETARENPDDTRGQAVVAAGLRTALFVALRREAELIGYLTAYRTEVRSFSDREIALLENFAAQAAIAMENARLITETREALEQQTATAEVLQVINASPGDPAPVFDAILEKAHSLCGAPSGSLQLYDGQHFRAVATRGMPEPFAALLRQGYRPHTSNVRLLDGDDFVQVADMAEIAARTPEDRLAQATVEIAGIRTLLRVALRRDGALLGAIIAGRHEVRPFSDKQIALLQNFAAQAVIAMENARLITETREALEQQTATTDILRIISSSATEVQPVFEAIVDRSIKLCDAEFAGVARFDEDGLLRLAATSNLSQQEAAAFHSLFPRAANRGFVMGRALLDRRPVNVEDVLSDPEYDQATQERLLSATKYRSFLGVPMMRDGMAIGVIGCARRRVQGFTAVDIEVLNTFADQAVIAIENAKLMTETREALEQQTATAEVLGVINSSPGDLAPVFDAMLEKATALCGAAFGILWTYDGTRYHAVAFRNVPQAYVEFLREPQMVGPETTLGQIAAGELLAHIADLAEEIYSVGHSLNRRSAELGGFRTVLGVGLRKDEALLGAFTIYRQEVRPFTDKQVALVQNFAAQAVIAIENTRLLNEIRQRQAELRVTFDNMADGVAMFDEHLRLAAWNKNFQQIADVPEGLLAERPSYADYLRILSDRGELDINSIDEELTHRLEHTDQELRLERTRPNGQVIEVRRSAVPDGGFVLIYSDITERKRSEAEIRAARDLAEATLRDLRIAQSSLIQTQKMAALGQLTAGIAHEIKNPLNFVNNFAGLSVELLDELKEAAAPGIAMLDEDKRVDVGETMEMLTGNLEKIAEHGRRADNIVKSMLEHSRGVTSERRKADLNNLVEEALNLAYHGARAQDQTFNITLDRDYGRDLAQIELVPQEISRVFINLIGNGFYAATKRNRESGAADFRPKLLVTTRDLGDAVEVRVRDNGIGIPVEIQDKLFQPFFTTKPTGEGTGLGLSISYDIVTQQHGGSITVESEPGAFTEFTVRLPRAQRAPSAGAASWA